MDLQRALVPHLVSDQRTVAGAVYGTVSAMALIVTASHDERSAGKVFAFAAISTVVLWAVHVYAATLASAGSGRQSEVAAMRHALRNETGVMEGAVAPLAALLLGVVGFLEDGRAIWLSLWVGVGVLFVVPVVWLRRVDQAWWRSLLWGLAGGMIGLALTSLKVILH